MTLTKDNGYKLSCVKHLPYLEFQPSEHRRRGFQTGQLLEYTFEPNPDAKDDPDAPPQKFALAFSTTDVVILGWRLDRLAESLREDNLATVHAMPKRYGDLDPSKPFVASIEITPIAR